MKKTPISRRDLLGAAAAAGVFTIVPSHVLAAGGKTPPSERLNIAGVGVGGMDCRQSCRGTAMSIRAGLFRPAQQPLMEEHRLVAVLGDPADGGLDALRVVRDVGAVERPEVLLMREQVHHLGHVRIS